MGFNYLKAIATTFIKTTLKDSKKLKKLQIMYKNTIYIWISRYNKSLFPVKKYWRQQKSWGVSRNGYIFCIFFR